MTFQPLPEVTGDSAAFWGGGAAGVLNIHRCQQCRTWFHPPTPVCPSCLSIDVAPEATSGRATVQGHSVNVQPWAPDMQVPITQPLKTETPPKKEEASKNSEPSKKSSK